MLLCEEEYCTRPYPAQSPTAMLPSLLSHSGLMLTWYQHAVPQYHNPRSTYRSGTSIPYLSTTTRVALTNLVPANPAPVPRIAQRMLTRVDSTTWHPVRHSVEP
eukprot:148310-Rhodomonas_salina.4